MNKCLSLLFVLALLCTSAWAEPALTAEVFVSITDASGVLALAYAPVTVTDADADGVLTLNDALHCAHAAHHPEGTAAYASTPSEWGISLLKLWGADTGSSYGYCVNHVSALGLADSIASGDHVKAYVYTDLNTWSDTYSFFSQDTLEVAPGTEVSFTLMASGFDADWMPVTFPVAEAVITVNGEAASAVTNGAGQAALTFDEAGVYVVSAFSDSINLVAPVCIVTVK